MQESGQKHEFLIFFKIQAYSAIEEINSFLVVPHMLQLSGVVCAFLYHEVAAVLHSHEKKGKNPNGSRQERVNSKCEPTRCIISHRASNVEKMTEDIMQFSTPKSLVSKEGKSKEDIKRSQRRQATK